MNQVFQSQNEKKKWLKTIFSPSFDYTNHCLFPLTEVIQKRPSSEAGTEINAECSWPGTPARARWQGDGGFPESWPHPRQPLSLALNFGWTESPVYDKDGLWCCRTRGWRPVQRQWSSSGGRWLQIQMEENLKRCKGALRASETCGAVRGCNKELRPPGSSVRFW